MPFDVVKSESKHGQNENCRRWTNIRIGLPEAEHSRSLSKMCICIVDSEAKSNLLSGKYSRFLDADLVDEYIKTLETPGG